MTEQEINLNQGRPELTRNAVNPTLVTGDIFMANEGKNENSNSAEAGPRTPHEVADHLERLSKRRSLSMPETTPEKTLPRLDITKERVAVHLLGKDLNDVEQTREQVEATRRLLEAIDQGGDAVMLAESALQEMSGEIPPSSIAKFRKRIKGMAKLKTQLVPPVLERLVDDIRNEPQKLADKASRQAEADARRVAETSRVAEEKRVQTQRTEDEKIKLVQAWSNRFPITDTTPAQVRDFIRAAIDNNVSPDQIKEEAMKVLEEMSGVAPTEQGKFLNKIGEIFDDPETTDSFDGISKSFNEVPPDIAEQVLSQKGQEVIKFLTNGLPADSTDKHVNELNGLNKDNKEEFVQKFKEILNNIKSEREAAGLEGPGEKEARETLERLISDDSFADLKRIIPEAPDDPEEPMSASESVGGEKSMEQRLISIMHDIENLSAGPHVLQSLLHNPEMGGLIGIAYGVDGLESKEKEWRNILDALDPSSEQSIRQTQARLSNFFNDLTKRIDMVQRNEEQLPTRVKSVQELSRWIIETQDSELWGVDGIYPLLDKDQNFSPTNFVMWMRDQSVKRDKDNPNSEMKPLNSVGITTDFREISIYAMSLLKEQYLRDKNGKVYTKMAQEMVYEAFMYGEIRNEHLFYVQGMGDDKKIAEVMQQVHGGNAITRPGNLAAILRMPARFEDMEKGDTRVGDAFRMGLEMYRHISDKEELLNILGNYPLTKEDFKNALRILQDKYDWDKDLDDWGKIKCVKNPAGEVIDFIYNDEGKTKALFDGNGNIDMDAFVTTLNFYNAANEDITKIDFVRELFRLKTAQKFDLPDGIALRSEDKADREAYWKKLVADYGGDEERAKTRFLLERSASRVNIEWAERLAYNMQRPYGGAAENDLRAAAADAFVKLNRTEKYLLKLSRPDSGGAVGLPEQIGIFKSLAPNMLTALKTESGDSIAKILKELRKIDNSQSNILSEEEKIKAKDALYKKLVFKENAEVALTRNQYVRATQIFHKLADAQEIDLSKIVTYSFRDGTRYNVGEFQKQINEELIKLFRYAITNSELNFGDAERIYTGDDNDGNPVYVDGTVAQKMFGPQILNNPNLLDRDGDLMDLNSKAGRQRLAKNCSMAVIAAQLSSHVKSGGLAERWGFNRTEILLKALETIQEYEVDEKTGKVSPVLDKDGNPARYYSKADIAWIRKNSSTEIWRMVMKDTIRESGGALGGAFLEMLSAFVKSTIKN